MTDNDRIEKIKRYEMSRNMFLSTINMAQSYPDSRQFAENITDNFKRASDELAKDEFTPEQLKEIQEQEKKSQILQIPQTSQESKPFNPSDYRVLVIDDDEDILGSFVGGVLKEKGYDFKWVGNGIEALETIPVYNPNVALVDNNMPVMRGEELIPVLRANPKYSKLKLIATGQGFSDEILAMCDAVVTKPYEIADLYSSLESVLSKA